MVFVHFVVCVFVWFMVDFVFECVFARNICLSKTEMFLQNGEGGMSGPLFPRLENIALFLCVAVDARSLCVMLSVTVRE